MMIIDFETGIIVEANRAAHNFYGYPNLIDKNIGELNIIPRDELREVLAKSAALRLNHYATRHKLADKSIKDVDVYSYPVEINGRVFLFGVINDITEKLKSDEALKNKTRMIILSIITSLIMLSFFTIFLLRNYNERKKSEDKIKKLLSEKELLLKEVHHRIKNNMNTIKGLLSLQILSQENSAAEASLKGAESRVNSMIMLYDRLYTTDNYRELSVKEYLEPLVEEIVGSFPGSGRIKLETKVDDFILNVKILSPLGIIVNELITNIMKYAFSGMEYGEITLTAKTENDRVIIVIKDNGVGIPESVDFGCSSGFGLDLVKMLVEQIEGNITIERDRGTKFVLEFPV
jgi:PAS domain S-box-containing protein